jgi:hypothetical protein
MLLKKRCKWLDLAFCSWSPLVGLPLVKYSKPRLSLSLKNYYWFLQYMGGDNGDVRNILPFLGIMYF